MSSTADQKDTPDRFAARAKALLAIPGLLARLDKFGPTRTADEHSLAEETKERLEALQAKLREGRAIDSIEAELLACDRVIRWLEGKEEPIIL